MKIDAQHIIALRTDNAWTQEELAIAAGLSLKTVQRIENRGAASLQSIKALASVFNLDAKTLNLGPEREKRCPECGSDQVYKFTKTIETNPECLPHMLPKLGSGLTFYAEFVPVVCADCGYIRYFADEKARKKLADSAFWQRLD